MSDQPAAGNRIPADLAPAETCRRAALRQAGVVHDVNQMLAVILGRAELLLQREATGHRGRTWRPSPWPRAMRQPCSRDCRGAVRRGRAGYWVDGQTLRDTVRGRLPSDPSRGDRATGRGPGAGSHGAGPGFMERRFPEDLFTSVPGQVVREVLSNLVVNALEALPAAGESHRSRREGRPGGPDGRRQRPGTGQ